MPFVARVTAEQWAHARRRRAEGATYAQIAADVGVSLSAVKERGRRDRWKTPRRPRRSSTPQCGAALAPRIFRLLNLQRSLLELKMTEEEKAARKGGKVASQDDNTRAVGALIKHIQQTQEFHSDPQRAAEGGGKPTADAQARAVEEDSRRRDVAERIEKLVPPSGNPA
jgi:hypothetical protein